MRALGSTHRELLTTRLLSSKLWPAFLDLSDMILLAQTPKLDADEDSSRTRELDHQVIMPATKPDYLSLSLRTHMVKKKEELTFHKLSSNIIIRLWCMFLQTTTINK